MNRRIVEIDAEMARLRCQLLDTQKQIEGLAEERGRALAAMENDTSFQRKTRANSVNAPK
jgi:hypothetical protein